MKSSIDFTIRFHYFTELHNKFGYFMIALSVFTIYIAFARVSTSIRHHSRNLSYSEYDKFTFFFHIKKLSEKYPLSKCFVSDDKPSVVFQLFNILYQICGFISPYLFKSHHVPWDYNSDNFYIKISHFSSLPYFFFYANIIIYFHYNAIKQLILL